VHSDSPAWTRSGLWVGQSWQIKDPSGVSIGRLSGVDALWDCVSRVCDGGGGCASGGVPRGAGPCCPDVGRCLSGVYIIIIIEVRSVVAS